MSRTRIGFFADTHCGHRTGLTPPAYQHRELAQDSSPYAKYYKAQIELWNAFDEFLEPLRPFKYAVFNGDMIDGNRSGSECIQPDRNVQANMAIECINHVGADTILMTYGTPRHVNTKSGEDFEDIIAREVGAEKIDHQLFLDINGCIINCKHNVGRSSIPHGRFTPVSREWLDNRLRALRNEEPPADIFIRSHVHYSIFCGEPNNWLAITTPALQGKESKFGARICNGTVDFGFVVIDIEESGDYTWRVFKAVVESQKAQVIKL